MNALRPIDSIHHHQQHNPFNRFQRDSGGINLNMYSVQDTTIEITLQHDIYCIIF